MSWEAWGEPDEGPELPDGWLSEEEAEELREALAESLKLQSHYAELLNAHDGGQRMTFPDVDSWLARLRELSANAALSGCDAKASD